MNKFKLTNPIEFKTPSQNYLFIAKNTVSKYGWIGLSLLLLLVATLFYYIGKAIGKKSKSEYRYYNSGSLGLNNSVISTLSEKSDDEESGK